MLKIYVIEEIQKINFTIHLWFIMMQNEFVITWLIAVKRPLLMNMIEFFGDGFSLSCKSNEVVKRNDNGGEFILL